VKKTQFQKAGKCEVRFTSDASAKRVEFKNKGSTTEIRVPPGLPRNSKANRKAMLETHPAPVQVATLPVRPIASLVASTMAQNNSRPNLSQSNSAASLVNQIKSNSGVMGETKLSATSLSSQRNVDSMTASMSNSQLNNASASSINSLAGKRRPPPPPAKKTPKCKAMYDYEANEADELGFMEGDMISLVSKDDSGWWKGTVHGKTGLFPANVRNINAVC
jgi:myosin-1